MTVEATLDAAHLRLRASAHFEDPAGRRTMAELVRVLAIICIRWLRSTISRCSCTKNKQTMSGRPGASRHRPAFV
jgi:hypothetical protein